MVTLSYTIGAKTSEKGKLKNAVSTFVLSMWQSNSSFSDMSLPEDFRIVTEDKVNSTPSIDTTDQVKNVIVIVMESAGARYMDAWGGNYNITPNLNAQEKNAMVFRNAFAHVPATNKSMVALLCSVYPWISYKSLTQEYPQMELPSLPSVLKKEGYRTSYFTSSDFSFQSGNKFLEHRDFDVIEDYREIACDTLFSISDQDFVEGNGIDDYCLGDRLMRWIDSNRDENFFSVLWTVQAHYPYYVSGDEIDFDVGHPMLNRYLNALRRADELIGSILDALSRRNLDKSTLVIVVGDHGEAFGSHEQYGHASYIYQENLHVPLYFINPVLFKGESNDEIAGLKDIGTTILAILGMEQPEGWQGSDLLSINNDNALFFAPWSDFLFGYREGNMKYIFNETYNTVEVYDLEKDPSESNNIYRKQSQEKIEEIRLKMAARIQYQDNFIKEQIRRTRRNEVKENWENSGSGPCHRFYYRQKEISQFHLKNNCFQFIARTGG